MAKKRDSPSTGAAAPAAPAAAKPAKPTASKKDATPTMLEIIKVGVKHLILVLSNAQCSIVFALLPFLVLPPCL